MAEAKDSPSNPNKTRFSKENPKILETYVADHFPPNVRIAEQHGLAKRVAKEVRSDQENQQPMDYCDCCGLPVKNEILPLSSPRSELVFLGPGFPLYFEFIVYCAFLLGIMISVEGIYNIISNYIQGRDCDDEDNTKCTNSNINLISLANKLTDQELYKIQCWVNFGCAVAIMISLQYFRKIQRATNLECDRGLLSPSDYSLMISQIPTTDYTEKEIRELLLEFWKKIPKSEEEEKKGFPVKKIVFSYNIGKFIELVRKKNNLLLEKRRAIAYQKKHNSFPLTFDTEKNEKEFQKTSDEIDKYEKEAENNNWKEKCGVVLISFNTEQDKNVFFERCTLTPFQKIMLKIKMVLCCKTKPENLLFFKGKFLVVEKAPEPNDILWENLHYSTKYKIKIRGGIYSIAFIILMICFGIILGISFGQSEAAISVKHKSYTLQVGVTVLGVVVSFVISFINIALTLLLKFFGNLEKHSTLTHLNISNSIKLGFAQFFNTAILILVVKLITIREREETKRIFSPGYNFSSDVVSIFCTNAILTSVLNILNPWYCIRLCKRRKIRKEGVECLLTQAEANKAFEGGDIDLSAKYAGLMKTVWLSAFYLPVTPIGSLISFFGIVLFYYVEKYLLLRRLSRPPLISSDLNEEMVELLEYVPFAMGCGSLFFHYILFDPTRRDIIPDLLTICLSGVNFIFPHKKLNECIFPFADEAVENIPYDEARITFATDYDRANPVTQEAAMAEWVTLVERKKGITLKLESKIEPSINDPNAGDRRVNMCLVNYANANFEKINNMIAQAPQNFSTNSNILPFYNILQQQGIAGIPNTFSNFMGVKNQGNSNKLPFYGNDSPERPPEQMPLINQNPPPINNAIFNQNPPQQMQNQGYAYPQIYPPNMIQTPSLERNNPYQNQNQGYMPQANINPPFGYNPNMNPGYDPNMNPPGYDPNMNPPGYNPQMNIGYNPNYGPNQNNLNIDPYSNYNSELSNISNRDHNVPPQTFVNPGQQMNPYGNYGNYQ